MKSLRLRGLEEGGRGGSGHLLLAIEVAEAGESWELGSGGGVFSLEDFLCFRLDLGGVGFGEEEFSIGSLKFVFLGNMKCFIFAIFFLFLVEKKKRERKVMQ